ncbi:ankyrin-1-like [Lytechinus variegatus]|uniref:ankyrin-1-like n=1 Tax=Lytechinus variegatus TaxID=7654 RepID=UPI001BB29C10|nr:ankyrin-1-like [Lytechinus variegatus]
MSKKKLHNPLNFFQENRGVNQQKALDTALVQCCLSGDDDAVIDLLQKGASPEGEAYAMAQIASGENFKRPLMAAVMNGHKKIAQLLLDNGADPCGVNRYHVQPIHLAAHAGHRDCVTLLLNAGANANAETSDFNAPGVYKKPFRGGTTPLHMAAKLNRSDCIEELVQRGHADLDKKDVIGMNCLNTACQLGHEESALTILRLSQEKKIAAKSSIGTGNSPLHDCVRCGLLKATKALLDYGVEVNAANPTGYTPLHFAMIQTSDAGPDLIRTLILHGRDIEVNLPNRKGLKPLHLVAFKSDGGEHFHHVHTIEYHMSRDHITLDPGRPRYDPELTCFLLQYGADFNIEYHGRSLLQQEIYNKDDEDDDVILDTILRATDSFEIPYHPSPRDSQVSQILERLTMLKTLFSNPRPLQHLCRLRIRRLLRPTRLNRVGELAVPDRLKEYILLKC